MDQVLRRQGLRCRRVHRSIARAQRHPLMSLRTTGNRCPAIDGRTTRHPGYAISGQRRKRVEEIFGWTKATTGLRKTRHRGVARVSWILTLTATAYNLVRLPKLLGAAA
jgi:IS5 family transposase